MGRSLLRFSSLSFRSLRLWPYCKQPKTHSFRATAVSSASFESAEGESFSTEEPAEAIVRGLRSERLFFEPGESTRSLLGEVVPFTGGVAVVMESEDPFEDFRISMEEMVLAYHVKDSDGLEKMLSWYLSHNGMNVHGFIVGAFVDLLVCLDDFRHPFSYSTSSSSSSSWTFDEGGLKTFLRSL